MKNKKLNYILIPAVVILWAIIIYQFFSGTGAEEYVPVNKMESRIPVSEAREDSFALLADYQDPFTARYTSVLPSSGAFKVRRQKKVPAPPPLPPAPVTWPGVDFMGTIKNQSSNKYLAMIRINNKDTYLQQGDSISGFKIDRITRDSLVIAQGKARKTIKRNY